MPQLEHTTVRIRERSFLEILDLALLLARRHAVACAVLGTIGALPLWALNRWLALAEWSWYLQAWVYALELPLASAPMTLFLGQSVFVERPSLTLALRELVRALPRFVFHQVLVRGLLLGLVLAAPYVYVRRTYNGEVVLLESGRSSDLAKRSAGLHTGQAALIGARWLGSLVYGAFAAAAVSIAAATLSRTFQGRFGPPEVTAATFTGVEAELAFWAVGGFLAVVRLLAYLDLRVRREGWEVELRLRAAAKEIERAATGPGRRTVPGALRRIAG